MTIPATPTTPPPPISDELRAAITAWLEWRDNGAPYGASFFRHWGLCDSVGRYADRNIRTELEGVLYRQFGTAEHPFGRGDFWARSNTHTQHECPKRIAFARWLVGAECAPPHPQGE